ncbi:MAG: glycosyltransferase [Bacteroidaceae bacterium]
MRILLFTDFAPTKDNYRGPSALCFHLMKELQKEHEVEVITTNANKVPEKMLLENESALLGRYIVCPRTKWKKVLISRKTGRLFTPFFPKDMLYLSRYKLERHTLKHIEAYKPDVIFIYPSYLTEVCRQLKGYPLYVIGPDCSSINNMRALKDPALYLNNNDYNKECINLKKHIAMEKRLCSYAKKVFLVGREDTYLFNVITRSRKAIFLPHPHYVLREQAKILNSEKLKIVITGGYDFATKTDIDAMVVAFKNNKNMRGIISVTFLGKNWGEITDKLKDYIEVHEKKWVENYQKELLQYDIQLFPISRGAGTKGKVLEALGTGLLGIGSYYAFENIAAKPGKDCLIYKNAIEIPRLLLHVLSDRSKYQVMAQSGMNAIRTWHRPDLCAQILLHEVIGEKVEYDESKYYSEMKI